ncbi:polycystin-1-like protein 3 [Ptychodera flava]|uniref:polycystin-1-like protein 3 n=1 Tax=Ptychodera flava TaxID=63121 RepID=UPI003969F2FB
MFASDLPVNEEHVLVEGIYLDMDDVTYFGTVFKVSNLDHAFVIMLENSELLYGNATSYIFNDVVMYSNQYRGYMFSVDVQFSGHHSKIFIPDDYFMATGFYYLTFTIPGNREMKFSMAVKGIMCTYMEKRSSTWDRNGCQVSSMSNLTSTVCLCNHVTTFNIAKV